MNYRFLMWLLLAALTVSLIGCAGTNVRRESTRVMSDEEGLRAVVQANDTEFEDIDRRAYHYYVNGLLFEGLKDLQSASESYSQAWKFCPESAEIGLAYARSLVQVRNFSKAIDVLGQMPPQLADVLVLKALCFRRLSDHERARQTYLDLILIDSTSKIGYMFLASYYRQVQNLDSTIWALVNLARTSPTKHEVQNELGQAYAAAGDLARARQAFRHSLELKPPPSNMEALLRLSETYESDGQPDSSIALLDAAVEKVPDNAVLHSELARLWLLQDSTTRALPHLRSVAGLAPEDYLPQRRLAIMLMAADSLEAADSILTALVEAGDPDPASHFYLGRLGILTQDYERARDELLIVTSSAGNLPDAWLALGFSYRRLDQPDKEINAYQSGLLHMREETAAVQLYFALGAAFEQNGQVDSAIVAFEEIIKHNPDHAPSLNYLGYTLADRGIRLEYARKLLARAVELQPNNAAYLDSYGWVFYRLGDFDSAVQYLSSAAELDSDPVIYDHFGDALQALGEPERAHEWWRKALEQQPDNESIREKLSR